jgi:hypothetical protein
LENPNLENPNRCEIRIDISYTNDKGCECLFLVNVLTEVLQMISILN